MPPPPLPPFEKTAWNAWWTLLWAFALLIIWQVTLTLGIGYALILDGSFPRVLTNSAALWDKLEGYSFDGDIVGASAFSTIFVICPLCWLLGKVRPRWGGWEYLGAKPVKWWQWPLWAAVTVGLALLFGLLAPYLGIDEIDDSMQKMSETTNYPILLFLGVAVAAPLVEEFIFRGVIYRGWRESRLGLGYTLILTSAIWTLLHVQYPGVVLGYLFIFGIILGLAREWTGSIWIPVWMHFVNNALASLEMLQGSS